MIQYAVMVSFRLLVGAVSALDHIQRGRRMDPTAGDQTAETAPVLLTYRGTPSVVYPVAQRLEIGVRARS